MQGNIQSTSHVAAFVPHHFHIPVFTCFLWLSCTLLDECILPIKPETWCCSSDSWCCTLQQPLSTHWEPKHRVWRGRKWQQYQKNYHSLNIFVFILSTFNVSCICKTLRLFILNLACLNKWYFGHNDIVSCFCIYLSSSYTWDIVISFGHRSVYHSDVLYWYIVIENAWGLHSFGQLIFWIVTIWLRLVFTWS